MNKNQNLVGYLFILPSLIGALVFFAIPMLSAFVLSFTDWKGLSFEGTKFIGLENYIQLLSDSHFWKVIKNTALYLLYVPISIIISFILATILNRSVYLKNLLRAFYFLPYITGGIAISFVWMLLFHPSQGPINQFLKTIGISNPPAWLAATNTSMFAIIIIMTWFTIGFNMIIYLAAMQDVSQELEEAAKIDGANRWQVIRHIIFPLVSPITFFLMVVGFITAVRTFGMIYVITQGGPAGSTTVFALDIYLTAFRYYELGYGASMSIILFLFVLIMTLLQFYLQKKWVSY